MIWAEFEEAAPEIARLGRERFVRAGVALLGTLRRDGSPRISPVEPHFVSGHLLFAAMSWSVKARDLERDPRCVLHSAVSDPDGSEDEFKLFGRAGRVEDQELREGDREAWWVSRPPGSARVFDLSIERGVVVSWETERAEMLLRRWSPKLGLGEVRRSYP
jgi:hypothetical protein